MHKIIKFPYSERSLFEIAYQIRIHVFVEEQAIPIEEELDADDEISTHFLIYFDEFPVGTARLVLGKCPDSDIKTCHLGRLAILREYRGRGLGIPLVQAVHQLGQSLGYEASKIHGQSYAVPFYEKVGYKTDENAEPFMECGIEHQMMTCFFAK
jgi:predicted GNAT family N-acyltransferase